jgi:hypothetical protein
MSSLVLGLAAGALALFIQRVALCHRGSAVRTAEQAYRFHELRDELQLLVIDGKLSSSSYVYLCLVAIANLCIRNAGVFRLRDLVAMTSQIDQKMEGRSVVKAVQEMNPAVQETAGKIFYAFAQMLISNDSIVRFAFHTARFCQPAIEASKWLLVRIDPTRTEAFRQARRYLQLAHTMGV